VETGSSGQVRCRDYARGGHRREDRSTMLRGKEAENDQSGKKRKKERVKRWEK